MPGTDERYGAGRSADRHAMPTRQIELRFYAELNDFLPAHRRHGAFIHAFAGTPSVKDTIESVGVPHTEVDVILVDGRSVDFTHRLAGGERVAVYPMFERLDVSPVTRLRPQPLRVTRFILDVHLGKLAQYLRLLGFDAAWHRHLADEAIIDIAAEEKRIVLTRDKGILKHSRVTHGYWLRATDPVVQLEEVVSALDLVGGIRPYSRCMACNGEILPISKSEAAGAVPSRVWQQHQDFSRCAGCGRIYWPGSHQKHLDAIVARVAAHRTRGSRSAWGHLILKSQP